MILSTAGFQSGHKVHIRFKSHTPVPPEILKIKTVGLKTKTFHSLAIRITFLHVYITVVAQQIQQFFH